MKNTTRCAVAVFCALALICTTFAAVAAEPVPLFTGSNSYVNIGTPAALQIPSDHPFTVEGWMRFNSLKIRDMLYSKSTAHTGSPYSFMLGFTDTSIAAYDGSAWQGQFAVTRETNRWYHTAFSFDGTNMAFYLDGDLMGTTPFTFNNTLAHTAKIGGYATTADVDGNVSDVRVWDHARDQDTIQAYMFNRLFGTETGLLGYWRLNEGTGISVGDSTTNGNNGTLSNATWVSDADLALAPAGADFIGYKSFNLVNIETGSTRFTNSNKVDMAAFPIPEGYDQYQITPSGDIVDIDSEGWFSTNTLPGPLDFDLPASDTNVIFYAWFTNTTESVSLRRSQGVIRYTREAPMGSLRATETRVLIPGYPVVINTQDIDDASTGGETDSETIPIHTMTLNLSSGIDTNATPGTEAVTVSETGTYTIKMVVQNDAGNMATSEVCTVTVSAYDGGDFVWNGSANDDWHTRANWNYTAVPHAGMRVVINAGATVKLNASTAALASLTMNGGSLTFSNWTTTLTASEVTITAGNVTTPLAQNNSSDTNRVHFICDKFFLAQGASINVDECGYGGGFNPPNSSGRAPGRGPGAGSSTWESDDSGGASHGGRGGDAIHQTYYKISGPINGDPYAPLGPGSSGGSKDGRSNQHGGHGGGAVRIDAAGGQVVINGTISANGGGKNNYTSGGAGGAVITCDTFTGTNGVIQANGADDTPAASTTASGGGGGGRIAVIFDLTAQTALPIPDVTFSVRGGKTRFTGGSERDGDIGTLYFPDERWFRTDVIPHTGQLLFGNHPTTLSFDSLTMDNAWVRFPDNIETITITNDLTISGNGGLLDVGGNGYVTGQGRWSLNNTAALPPTLDVGGDVVLTNGGSLRLVAAAMNLATTPNGIFLNVAGTIDIANKSVLSLLANVTNGASPQVTCGDMFVQTGGTIDAFATGFAGGRDVIGKGFHGAYGGGGHGGKGGPYSASYSGGAAHDDPLHPNHAGTGGGRTDPRYDKVGGSGGGRVRLITSGDVTIDGTINASGYDRGTGYSSGGAGGAIYIDCHTFAGTGTLAAAGGYGGGSGGNGGGGGGCIAVWYGKPYVEGMVTSRLEIAESVPPKFNVTANVANGSGLTVGSNTAEPGTIRFVRVLPIQGSLFLLR